MKNTFFRDAKYRKFKNKMAIPTEMALFFNSLKNNPALMEKPWILSEGGLGAHNALTKTPYLGIYQLYLSFLCLQNDYKANRWLTPKQIKDLGGRVKQGEKKNSLNVLNVIQCEGLPAQMYKTVKSSIEFNPIGRAEDIMKKCDVDIHFPDGFICNLSSDYISYDKRKKFQSVPAFYNYIFHQVGHWTGQPELLNRYYFKNNILEDLTAELCSVFVNSALEIDLKFKHSERFLETFHSVFIDDVNSIITAVNDAQIAATYILSLEADNLEVFEDNSIESPVSWIAA